jgi:hypothetical protein
LVKIFSNSRSEIRIENVGGATEVFFSPMTAANELISSCVTVMTSTPAKLHPTQSGLSINEFRGEVLKICNEDRTS